MRSIYWRKCNYGPLNWEWSIIIYDGGGCLKHKTCSPFKQNYVTRTPNPQPLPAITNNVHDPPLQAFTVPLSHIPLMHGKTIMSPPLEGQIILLPYFPHEIGLQNPNPCHPLLSDKSSPLQA